MFGFKTALLADLWKTGHTSSLGEIQVQVECLMGQFCYDDEHGLEHIVVAVMESILHIHRKGHRRFGVYDDTIPNNEILFQISNKVKLSIRSNRCKFVLA
jgi:hypothetical protein